MVQNIVEFTLALTQILEALGALAPKLIAFSAVISAFIPPTSNPVIGGVLKYINMLAFNFNYAKNAPVQDDD